MQRVGFSVPLLLATPVYVVILIILKENNVDLLQDRIGLNNISGDYKVALVCFIIGWFAQLWICRHVWESDGEERLAFTRKLFVLPHFVSAFIDLSMLHSRKHKTCDPAPGREDDTPIPKVYLCATMWHENRREMKQILTSIFRLDQREGRNYSNDDSYEFEAHIIFDDAMETTKQNPNEQTESESTNLVQNNEQNSNQKTESKPTKQIRFMEPNQSQQTKSKRTINDFVRQLMEVVKVAGRLFYEKGVSLEARKYHTPYGGRLEWTLPGQNKLIAHLKDKDKIRHKKRWSQAMNTYVLALDGDVDFQPHSVQLLLDRMKKNPNVGAACGRIKPGGSGPLVWYQKFEYAIGHWLQKSAEHVFGCVLCSPGCFSMFRMKALMDDNVMRTYASLPTEPKHVLQYDQGEDRWLCTLLLQQGYRIEYCAAAEALTFAPEEFKEFFNQRRRWMPSTMANIWDLLASHSRTTKKNRDISYFFIIYQFILFFSSILGPSTVLLAMYTGIDSVFSIPTWLGYCLVYVPVLLFIYACLRLKSNTQLNIAMVLSAIYALLMMAVLIGTLVSIASEGWYTPTGMFMYILIGTFILAGILHPHEFPNLIYGILYFICIPAGYLFLSIYAICNLNDASWGTREAQKAVLENSHKKRGKMKEAEKELGNYTSSMVDDMIKQVKDTQIANTSFFESIVSIFRWMYNLIILRSLESLQTSLNHLQTAGNFAKSMYQKSPKEQETVYESWDTSEVPGTLSFLVEEEKQFWNDLIKKYLEPLHLKKKNEEKGYDEKKRRIKRISRL
ncbi:hypothetical protein FSP39_017898 [Pinctada imbricata]|uniref:chitin synthase n=1 Tax=Pinctada imbricata TaxID=66713 RepID=A0AA89BXH4_PINIB|nr:hypothetical protein FSP39_017898 [Pinctada imbricata]